MNKIGVTIGQDLDYLDDYQKLAPIEVVQIFTHDNITTDTSWTEPELQELAEKVKRIYVHSIFKIVIGNSYGKYLFHKTLSDIVAMDKSSKICGYILHLPKTMNPNQCVNTIVDMITSYKGKTPNFPVYLEHIPSEYYCKPENMLAIYNNVVAKLNMTDKAKIEVGICIDTCHAYSAGYKFATASDVNNYFSHFTKEKNINLLIHLNDSHFEISTMKDHHAELGKNVWADSTEGLVEILKIDCDKIIELRNCNSSIKKILSLNI